MSRSGIKFAGETRHDEKDKDPSKPLTLRSKEGQNKANDEAPIKGLRDRGAICETVLLDAGQRGSPWSLRVEIRTQRPASSPIDFVSPRPIKSASSGFAE